MSGFCGNCHQIVNPGSITTPLMGNHYHADCLYCTSCGVYLWNKPFIKRKDGTLFCGDNECSLSTTSLKLPPIKAANETRISSRQNHLELNKYLKLNDPNMRRKSSQDSNTISSRSSQELNTIKLFEPKKFSKKVFPSGHSNEPFIYNTKQSDSNSYLPHIASSSGIEQTFADHCYKCFELVHRDKQTFNDKTYHKYCYICNRCQTELYRMKKVYADPTGEGLYCEPCYADMFGPKCAKCMQPVTPYMLSAVYEGQIYHKECFVCPRCKRSFAKEKMFKNGNLTICQNCF